MSQLFATTDWNGMLGLFVQAIAALLCIVVHEISHGLAAYALGDPTAKSMRRLSFNPIRHIDPFGLLMMITVGFGWAKPVPVNPGYFKRPQSGMALTALAGPMSNFIFAFIACAFLQGAAAFASVNGATGISGHAIDFLWKLVAMNLGLGIFNLIPFPPLDGSKILGIILPERLYFQFMRYENFGMIILMAALFFGFLDVPLSYARAGLLGFMLDGTSFIGTAVRAALV